MPTPYEKKEFLQRDYFFNKSKNGDLEVHKCIACWSDICGFGSILDKCQWDLNKMKNSNLLHILSIVHRHAVKPLLVNIDPYPHEIILVLNDGVARTVDLHNKNAISYFSLLCYLRDLIFMHANLLEATKSCKLGFRTILAGGEKVQYSSTLFTGESTLFHGDKISDFGQKLLDTNFVYNPAEFQMNTAFSKAYILDNLGSKHKIESNGIYVEHSFWNCINGISNLELVFSDAVMKFYNNKKIHFELELGEDFMVKYNNLQMKVNKILRFKALSQVEWVADKFKYPHACKTFNLKYTKLL